MQSHGGLESKSMLFSPVTIPPFKPQPATQGAATDDASSQHVKEVKQVVRYGPRCLSKELVGSKAKHSNKQAKNKKRKEKH